jgi:hypothetical protein
VALRGLPAERGAEAHRQVNGLPRRALASDHVNRGSDMNGVEGVAHNDALGLDATRLKYRRKDARRGGAAASTCPMASALSSSRPGTPSCTQLARQQRTQSPARSARLDARRGRRLARPSDPARARYRRFQRATGIRCQLGYCHPETGDHEQASPARADQSRTRRLSNVLDTGLTMRVSSSSQPLPLRQSVHFSDPPG